MMPQRHEASTTLHSRARECSRLISIAAGAIAAGAVALGIGLIAMRTSGAAQASGQNFLKQIVIGLHVYESGEFRPIPPIDWGDGTISTRGLCFDKPALDLETGQPIGEVTECFVDAVEIQGALSVRNVSFIKLRDGSIVARHRTTFQPMLDPKSPATHVVGALPAPDEFNVVSATGKYRNTIGQARIVGTVNLEHFRMDNESGIKFHDWVYLIQLQTKRR